MQLVSRTKIGLFLGWRHFRHLKINHKVSAVVTQYILITAAIFKTQSLLASFAQKFNPDQSLVGFNGLVSKAFKLTDGDNCSPKRFDSQLLRSTHWFLANKLFKACEVQGKSQIVLA